MDSLCDSVDPRVDLAVLRSELAWERTLLAWVLAVLEEQACAGSDQRLPDSAISSGAVGFNSRSRSGLCCVCGAEYRQEMTDAAGVPIAVVLSPARRRVTCDGVSFARCNVAIRRCGLPI